MGWMVRLWPLVLLMIVVILWRLWFLRARGEGDADSNARSRRRWKTGLMALIGLMLVGLLAEAMGGRPQEGNYRPLSMGADGRLRPASIGDDAAAENEPRP